MAEGGIFYGKYPVTESRLRGKEQAAFLKLIFLKQISNSVQTKPVYDMIKQKWMEISQACGGTGIHAFSGDCHADAVQR